MEKIIGLIEALKEKNYANIQDVLKDLLRKGDEDLLIITLRELIASGLLVPGSKEATVIGGIIADHEPRRSLLAKFAGKLGDVSMTEFILSWMDGTLARNVHLELEEWADEWSNLETVKEIRQILQRIMDGGNYESAIDPRCTPINGEYDPELDGHNPIDERCHPIAIPPAE